MRERASYLTPEVSRKRIEQIGNLLTGRGIREAGPGGDDWI